MTMAANALKRELKAQLASQGFSVEIDRWPQKLTYYKKNGEAMPNMPADPVTMHRYINVKGFTLTPPEVMVESKVETVDTVTAVYVEPVETADTEEEAAFQELLDAEKEAELNKVAVPEKQPKKKQE